MGKLHGLPLAVAMGIYLLVSILVLTLSTKAPGVCDVSTYVPLQLCWQLINNMLTGFFVWDDAARLEHTTPYLLSFLLCVLSVQAAQPGWAEASGGYLRKSLSQQLLTLEEVNRERLLQSWKEIKTAAPERNEEAEQHAKSTFAYFMKTLVSHDQGGRVADLCVRLYEARGTFAFNADMWLWSQEGLVLQRLVRTNPHLRQDILELMSEAELAKVKEIEIDMFGKTETPNV